MSDVAACIFFSVVDLFKNRSQLKRSTFFRANVINFEEKMFRKFKETRMKIER